MSLEMFAASLDKPNGGMVAQLRRDEVDSVMGALVTGFIKDGYLLVFKSRSYVALRHTRNGNDIGLSLSSLSLVVKRNGKPILTYEIYD